MALESYIGLVEAGVGLIPAGGGCKEFALRAADWAAQSATPGEVFDFLQPVFRPSPWPRSPRARQEAIDMGFARPSDTIVFNANELLYVAIREARAHGRCRLRAAAAAARHSGGRPHRHRHAAR